MSKSIPSYEIPTEMRDFAEKSVEQARKAFDGFISAASKAANAAETQAHSAQASSREVAQKAISYTEQNIAASFDYAQKIVRAKSLQDLMQVQAEFVKSQAEALQAQLQDVSSTVQSNVQKAAADAKATVEKATAEVTKAAKEATAAIPIVMAQDRDPVGNGFVASLARPGGNVTGLSVLVPELSGKQLQLLKQIVPKLSRVAVIGTSTTAGTAQSLRELKLAAEKLGLQLKYLDVQNANEIESAFKAATDGRAGAALTLPSPFFILQRTQLLELAAKSRLPVIWPVSDFMEIGRAHV